MAKNTKSPTRLLSAAKRGDVVTLTALLEAGDDVNARDADGRTPLMLAAEWGKLAAVELLLAAGAELDACDSHNCTALFYAMQNDRDAVVLKLWRAGADVSVQPGSVGNDTDMLQMAVQRGQIEWVRQLLQHPNMDVNRATNYYTPLHQADDPAMIEFLLAHGADVHARPVANQSAFVYAISSRDSAKVALLFAHVKHDVLRGDEGHEALFEAAKSGDVAIVARLLELGAPPNQPQSTAAEARGWSPLMIATRHDNVDLVQLLLDHGAHFNIRGFVVTPLLHALNNKAEHVVPLLLDHGADPSAVDGSGQTALELAIRADSPALVVVLLLRGLEPPRDCLTAAWMLIVQTEHVELAQRLRDWGADLRAVIPRLGIKQLIPPRTPEEEAWKQGLEALFGPDETPRYDPDSVAGFSAPMLAAQQASPQMLAWLLSQDVDLHARSKNGCTALLWAAADDVHLDSVHRLLAAGADPNQADHSGWTPLFAALRCGAAANAQALLAAGAQAAYVDAEGYTGLMAAVKGNCTELIPLLLAGGVDVNAQWDNETALDMAYDKGATQAVALIEQAGGVRGEKPAEKPAAEAGGQTLWREGYVEELAAQLKRCMPVLDTQALLDTTPLPSADDENWQYTLLYWLCDSLSAQRLIEYQEWKEYWGDPPDLAMLDDAALDAYDAQAIVQIFEESGADDSADARAEEDFSDFQMPPYLEYMNHVLKPQGLQMISFAFENLYMLCVGDDDTEIEKLSRLLREADIVLIEHESLTLGECRQRFAR